MNNLRRLKDRYDSASQVTSAGGDSYSYDANGNQNSSGFVIGPANEITSDGTWDYTYDAAGNVVESTNIASESYWMYSYNANNLATYIHDVFGDMISETTTSGGSLLTTNYAYDVSGASIGVNTTINPMWIAALIGARTSIFVSLGRSNWRWNEIGYRIDHPSTAVYQ